MKILLLLTTAMITISCGTNIYEAFDDQDPAEAASVALDDNKADEAIEILEAALSEDPVNYELISLLASAKAQKAGVDTMNFALEMATTGGSSGIVGLFGVVPEATASNIALLQEAVELLASIPEDQQIAADQFKLSMFYTSLLTLRTKLFDTDGDGTLSAEELLELDDASAEAILSDLLSAQGISSDNSTDDGTKNATNGVSSIAASIDNQEGDSDAEKLRNFLGS